MSENSPDRAEARTAAASAAGQVEGGFGIYVHWPFCLAKCPYCDFNSHVRERVDEARWRDALLAELDHYAAETRGRAVGSVFFGGGTPSLMAPETAAAVIERIGAEWGFAPDPEITLEANPGAAETDRFAGFADAGVNRVSIGVQSFDDAALGFLGRVHDRTEAIAAIERAARLFPRFSFDLIYARPDQDLAGLKTELDQALAFAGDHLSIYQLTIEPGTAFHTAHRLGAWALPDEDLAVRLYETVNERLEAAGLPAYEVSNHALPGGESRHNLTYWRSGDYVGVGPGAHGRITVGADRFATRQKRLPEAWLEAVGRDGHATEEMTALDDAERLEELVMMGLRLREGVPRAAISGLAGVAPEELFAGRPLEELVEQGDLVLDEDGLRTTPAGRLRLNAILAALLA